MALPSHFPIATGLNIPSIGIGTGTFKDDGGPARVKEIVLKALQEGYRHIDTAAAYGTEKAVGEAIKESGLPRRDLFVTTKLDQNWHDPEAVAEALNRSLENLQLDYVDLYMMHFPHAYVSSGPDHDKVRHPNGKPEIDFELSRDYPRVWKSMEKLVDNGQALALGVSNFNVLKLRRLLQSARIPPAVNQIEIHPYLPQDDVISFCRSNNIHVTAHQPLGGAPIDAVREHKEVPGPLFHPRIKSLAASLNITPGQVLLSWLLSRGLSIVPKTSKEHRLQENLLVGLPELDTHSQSIVDKIHEETGDIRYLQPRDYIGFDIFDEERDEPVQI